MEQNVDCTTTEPTTQQQSQASEEGWAAAQTIEQELDSLASGYWNGTTKPEQESRIYDLLASMEAVPDRHKALWLLLGAHRLSASVVAPESLSVRPVRRTESRRRLWQWATVSLAGVAAVVALFFVVLDRSTAVPQSEPMLLCYVDGVQIADAAEAEIIAAETFRRALDPLVATRSTLRSVGEVVDSAREPIRRTQRILDCLY